jgi:uncharacterized protein YgiM (DUF1202 family)
MNRFFMAITALALLTLACSLSSAKAQNMSADLPREATGTAVPAAAAIKASPCPTPPGVYFVTAQAVNMRACPGLECAIVDTLTGGQVVTVITTQAAPDGGTWSNVTTQAGQTGWVNSRFLEK